jgi:hypothetical protein
VRCFFWWLQLPAELQKTPICHHLFTAVHVHGIAPHRHVDFEVALVLVGGGALGAGLEGEVLVVGDSWFWMDFSEKER